MTENVILSSFTVDQLAEIIISKINGSKIIESHDTEIKYIETDAVLKILRCTAQSLVKYRRNGDVPFYKLGGRYKYIESEILSIARTGGVKYKKIKNA